MFGMGVQEFVIVAVVAVLLFGKRLPEVARSFGSSYRQFRQGLTDIQRQMDVTEYTAANQPVAYSDEQQQIAENYDEPTAPKFELPNESPNDDTVEQSDNA